MLRALMVAPATRRGWVLVLVLCAPLLVVVNFAKPPFGTLGAWADEPAVPVAGGEVSLPTPSPGAARLASGSQGVAATRRPGGAWFLLAPGQSLPSPCELRVSRGPVQLELPGVSLVLDGLTQCELPAAVHRCVLRRGRVYLAGDKLANFRLELAPPSRVARAKGDENAPAEEPLALAFSADAAVVVERAPDGAVDVLLARGELQTDLSERPWVKTRRWLPEPRSAEMEWLRRGASQGLGQLLVADSQQGSWRRLQVARHHVHMVLAPPAALVQIDQSFYNPHGQVAEGTFVFNLPPGAAVSRFAMYVTADRLVEGELIDRNRARVVYDAIVRRRDDPAILEQIGDNLFRMQVFPIFARDVKRVLLDYTVPLEPVGVNVADAKAAPASAAFQFHVPLLSDAAPIGDFLLTGELAAPIEAASARSPTHADLRVEPGAKGGGRFAFAAKNHQVVSDFVLEFNRPARLDAPEVRCYEAQPLEPPASVPVDNFEAPPAPERLPETYFQIDVPASPVAADEKAAPVDVLVLADTSSRAVRHHPAIAQALRVVVNNLRPADRVRIARVDAVCRPLTEAWIATDGADAQAALKRFDDEVHLGRGLARSSWAAALELFDESPPEPARRRSPPAAGR